MLSTPSLWRIEPWTGALSLDVSAAWSALDRLWPDADPDAASTLITAFVAGALAGWSRALATSKTRG